MNEDERADRLAEALDQNSDGLPITSNDPLMSVVAELAVLPFAPSAAATARFEAQLGRWFALRPRPRFPLRTAIALASALFIGIAIGASATFAALRPAPLPTMTMNSIGTPTFIPTNTPTVTVMASATFTDIRTPTLTPTLPATTFIIVPSPTPVPFAQIVIAGVIDAIQGGQIVVLGLPIVIEGGVAGLCVNDDVRVAVSIASDGTYHAPRSAVEITANACFSPPTFAPPSSGGSSDDDEDGGKGKKHDK